MEGRSDEIFLKAVLALGFTGGYFHNRPSLHFMDGFEKLSYAPEAVIQMLKTQSYAPVYKEKICGIFDRPFQNKTLLDEIRAFCGDTEKNRFIILDKPAIEYYYPLDVVNLIFGSELDQTSYEQHIDKFLKTIDHKAPYKGRILGQELSKVEFSKKVAELINISDLEKIDPIIIDLLKRADELSFA